MRGHVLHPLLIWRGPAEELSQPEFWAQYDIARIVGDCTMLDVRNAALGMQQRVPSVLSTSVSPSSPIPPFATPSNSSQNPHSAAESAYIASMSPPTARPTQPSPPTSAMTIPGKPRVSLQDMIATSVALKSGMDVEVVHPSPSWSTGIFPAQAQTRARSTEATDEDAATAGAGPNEPGPSRSTSVHTHVTDGEPPVPLHVAQALAGLQREVLLLRNELNFELWNARENVRHIGRLYQDRVLSKTAEVERQGLHNRLREYKSEVSRLQRQLKEQKEQSSRVTNQYKDWNSKMQDKLRDFREKEQAWQVEAAAMRAADKEAKATFAAQEKLLGEALQNVFQLETKIKESAHKVDRLRDYEKQIEQFINLQRLWELDVHKLNEQAEYLQVFTSKYKKMELRLETYEKTQAEMDLISQNYRQQIRSLEGQLAQTQRQLEGARKSSNLVRLSTAGEELNNVKDANQRLREENAELRDEVEEMRAMVELLKAQVSEKRGLVFEARSSRSGSGSQNNAPTT